MHIINNTFFSFFFIFLSITSFSQDIEEIIVKGDWREINVLEEDSSIVILNNQIIESQPIKHFENLSYLVPNLNFAASDSRARHFQIRGIGERSGYERTPNSAVGFLIDDIDYSVSLKKPYKFTIILYISDFLFIRFIEEYFHLFIFFLFNKTF